MIPRGLSSRITEMYLFYARQADRDSLAGGRTKFYCISKECLPDRMIVNLRWTRISGQQEPHESRMESSDNLTGSEEG